MFLLRAMVILVTLFATSALAGSDAVDCFINPGSCKKTDQSNSLTYASPKVTEKPKSITYEGCEYDKQQTVQIQMTLKKVGYYQGVVDGIWGPNTKRAIDMALLKHPTLVSTGACLTKAILNSVEQRVLAAQNNKLTKIDCIASPSACTIDELCQKAVIFSQGRVRWANAKNAQPYVSLAKSSGLMCGVQEQVVKNKSFQTEKTTYDFGKYQKRAALIIGNANYANELPLENPVNDARAVAQKLKTLGFDVDYRENLSRREMKGALIDFADKSNKMDFSFVYFAGHGMEINNQNFLIPIDAALSTAKDVEIDGVSVQEVVAASANSKKLSMVLIDACRDNPFTKRMNFGTRSVRRGLRIDDVDAVAANQIISFAASSGAVALDGDGFTENSPYARALLELLDQPDLEIGRLFRKLGQRVSELTNGAQQPVKRDSLRGEDLFLLVTQ